MTARQSLIKAIARKLYRMTKLDDQPMPDDTDINYMVESIARQDTQTWAYYLGQTDKQYFAMVRAARKACHELTF